MKPLEHHGIVNSFNDDLRMNSLAVILRVLTLNPVVAGRRRLDRKSSNSLPKNLAILSRNASGIFVFIV